MRIQEISTILIQITSKNNPDDGFPSFSLSQRGATCALYARAAISLSKNFHSLLETLLILRHMFGSQSFDFIM